MIVFINDKESHLKDAAEGSKDMGIDFIGLRYSYSDQRIQSFDRKIAEVQYRFSTFESIISDEEAQKILDLPPFLKK